MSEYPKPIGDDRLSAGMERVRSGRTQLFRAPCGSREFLSEKNADVVLQPPEPHIYADLINGVWTWVNGCAECNGKPRDWMTYIECEKHDVCCSCGTPRSKLTEAPWGGKHGWQCKPCANAEHEAEKAAALAAMPDEEDYDEWDYRGTSEIKCPHCDYIVGSEDHYSAVENDEVIECPRCDNSFMLSGEMSITWATRRIEKDGE